MKGTPITRSVRALMACVLAGIGMLTSGFILSPEPAQAETIACFIEATGTWVNPKARPGDVTTVEIQSHCEGGDLVHRVRVKTKCAPRDCTWGWTKGYVERGRFVASFSTFSAHRLIEMQVAGDNALIYVSNDYHNARRQDENASFRLKRDD
ncbi:hypothetical protein [Breoghania sp.]|uniref:hypothetical protein n=1 Tax=Breoghania sp. TaxID=2065378 RepID=UPI002AA7B1A1|nr:hypothetical protein [Breoghania sp.]